MNNDVSDNSITLLPQQINKIRSFLFNEPREISGLIQLALEKTLEKHEGNNSASIVEHWYRGAETTNYKNEEAAAAYLGAYGTRSILKYQESVFALLVLKAVIPQKITIVDYGCGPCPGFAALMDLWFLMSEITNQELEIKYIGVDRSTHMLNVGKTFCSFIKEAFPTISASFEFLLENDAKKIESNWLILSNVLNEGEGHLEALPILASIVERLVGLEDIIVIETATEQSSRQMCSLARNFEHLKHIGPCPSRGNDCQEWNFREFKKRIYDFERRCAGPLAGATSSCKYSLALLSFITVPRISRDDEYVIIRRLSASNRVLICKYGEKQWLRSHKGLPWDLISTKGVVTKVFP